MAPSGNHKTQHERKTTYNQDISYLGIFILTAPSLMSFGRRGVLEVSIRDLALSNPAAGRHHLFGNLQRLDLSIHCPDSLTSPAYAFPVSARPFGGRWRRVGRRLPRSSHAAARSRAASASLARSYTFGSGPWAAFRFGLRDSHRGPGISREVPDDREFEKSQPNDRPGF